MTFTCMCCYNHCFAKVCEPLASSGEMDSSLQENDGPNQFPRGDDHYFQPTCLNNHSLAQVRLLIGSISQVSDTTYDSLVLK